MMRRCSHCSHNGHNSRTCPNRGVKLFGVRLTDGSIRKSASMGNLSLLAGSSGSASPADGLEPAGGASEDGYASEDFVKGSSSSCRERKKGNPWTEEEHRMFLLGLQKLGKGDWRGISRNYVVSRTPTQVASHAQKYFIRKANLTRRKRRSSLFDMEPDEPMDPQPFLMSFQESDAQNNKPPPIPPTVDEECESMDSKDTMNGEEVLQPEVPQCSYPVMLPAYFSPFLQLPFPFWSGHKADTSEQQTHEIIKPTAVHSKAPINVDELVGMSKLSIGESGGSTVSSLDLIGGSRQSAFHANPSTRAQT
ncbi:transcription factor MYB1R1-like [Canna indica]|uniref:Transcription factor MYB1R1-like n=1 Tax=Canna indica TaxID=4628 RepID=A0AAQ3KIQ3_9LILI|nr:transcription factor MYB1R1-like [Canna indica]